ncbi:hypothetical protein HpBTM60_02060 [Helicobacter pylori]
MVAFLFSLIIIGARQSIVLCLAPILYAYSFYNKSLSLLICLLTQSVLYCSIATKENNTKPIIEKIIEGYFFL